MHEVEAALAALPVAVALTFQKLQQTIITANPTHQKEMDLRLDIFAPI